MSSLIAPAGSDIDNGSEASESNSVITDLPEQDGHVLNTNPTKFKTFSTVDYPQATSTSMIKPTPDASSTPNKSIPSPILPTTEAAMIAGSSGKLSNTSRRSSDAMLRALSFSTVSQSRFFPTRAAACDTKETVSQVPTHTRFGFSTSYSPSPDSPLFPDGLTGFSNLPSIRIASSNTSFRSVSPEKNVAQPKASVHGPTKLGGSNNTSAHTHDGGMNLGELGLAIQQAGESSRVSATGGYYAPRDEYPVSRHLPSPPRPGKYQPFNTLSFIHKNATPGATPMHPPPGFFPAEGVGANTPGLAVAQDSVYTHGSTDGSNYGNPPVLPPYPRGATNIESLEMAADTNGSQKSLTTTGPGQSWVTGISDWRSRDRAEKGRPLTWDPNTGTFVPGADDADVVPWATSPSQATALTQAQAPGPPGRSHARATHKIFKPMTAVLYPDASKRPLSEAEKASRHENGISANYQGNPFNPKNQSADIPNHLNCALFLTNLPARCTYQDLLHAIRAHRPGRVWSTYINRPLGPTDQHEHAQPPSDGGGPTPNRPLSHRTSAAKVIFYHPVEAQRLLAAADRGALRVGGRRVAAKWNRHRTAAQSSATGGGGGCAATSRAVVIAGPPAIVDERYLAALFDQYFEYQTEEVAVVAEAAGGRWRALEWRFGSMRAQAHSAHQLLRSLYPGVVSVRWAVDPCAGYLDPEEGGLVGGVLAS